MEENRLQQFNGTVAILFGFAKRDLCMYCITFGLMLSRWTKWYSAFVELAQKANIFTLLLELIFDLVWWNDARWRKGKEKSSVRPTEACPLFFSWRMVNWILLYLHFNTPPPSPLFQLPLCLSLLKFYRTMNYKRNKQRYIYQYFALDLSVLVLVLVFVFVFVLPVFVSFSLFMFLSLPLPLFLFLSCSWSCLCLCFCYCSHLCLCLCPCSCCCLCLIVPLLFLPAHQPVGGHEAALEQKI